MSGVIRQAARDMARHAIVELQTLLSVAHAYLTEGEDMAAMGNTPRFRRRCRRPQGRIAVSPQREPDRQVNDRRASPPAEAFADLCARLEHWETDPWAADAIRRNEILTDRVLDDCKN